MRIEFELAVQETRLGNRIDDVGPKKTAALRLVLASEVFGTAFLADGIVAWSDPTGRLMRERGITITTDTETDHFKALYEVERIGQRLAQLFDQQAVRVWIEGVGSGDIDYKHGELPEHWMTPDKEPALRGTDDVVTTKARKKS